MEHNRDDCLQCLTSALLSIREVYLKRGGTAESWRATQFLSLLADSAKIMAETTPITTVSHLLVIKPHPRQR